jgi:hypothetical protein
VKFAKAESRKEKRERKVVRSQQYQRGAASFINAASCFAASSQRACIHKLPTMPLPTHHPFTCARSCHAMHPIQRITARPGSAFIFFFPVLGLHVSRRAVVPWSSFEQRHGGAANQALTLEACLTRYAASSALVCLR